MRQQATTLKWQKRKMEHEQETQLLLARQKYNYKKYKFRFWMITDGLHYGMIV